MVGCVTKRLSKNIHNGCLTAASRTDKHEAVTHKGSFVQLDDFDVPGFDVFKVESVAKNSDLIFNSLIGLCGDAGLFGENVSNERGEQRLILGHELGQVHVSKGTGHNHLFVSSRNFLSLCVTSGTEYGENVS